MLAKRLRFTPTFERLSGAQLISAMITTALFGVSILMIIRYFSAHARNDPLPVKIVIGVLGILSTIETVFVNHQVYDFLISKASTPERRDEIAFSVPAKTACIFLAAFVSQLFYGRQIWKVGTSLHNRFRFALVPIVALAFLQLGGGLVQVVIMVEEDTFKGLALRVKATVESMYIHGAGAAACDILITISLVAILRSSDVHGTRRTKNLLEKLTMYAVNRGIITSTFALLSIFLYNFASGTYYYLIPFSANTQIYVISVLGMLISREGLREGLDTSFHTSDMIIGMVKTEDTSGSSEMDAEVHAGTSSAC